MMEKWKVNESGSVLGGIQLAMVCNIYIKTGDKETEEKYKSLKLGRECKPAVKNAELCLPVTLIGTPVQSNLI